MVYIFNEYTSSLKNGVGTFIREIMKCISDMEINCCKLSFNCPVKEVIIKKKNHIIQEILFPSFATSNFMDYYQVFTKILRLHIDDFSDNLFFINYSPCKGLVYELKNIYPKSKVVLLIHDLSWTSKLLGDLKLFKSVIKKKDLNLLNSEDDSYIIERYTDDVGTLSMADYVICLSTDTYNLLLSTYYVDESKLFLIQNGLCSRINLGKKGKKQLRRKYNIQDSEYLILFVGRLTRQKGIYSLFQSMRSVVKKKSSCRLLIAGYDDCFERLRLMEMFPELITHITFLGLLDEEKLYEWYAMADIGVIPSFYEQCTYAGIEMMMHGLPMVVSDGFGLNNMFVNRKTALLAHIDYENDCSNFSTNLAIAIKQLLSSKELRRELGKNAKQYYRAYYDGKLMYRKYHDFLLSVLK